MLPIFRRVQERVLELVAVRQYRRLLAERAAIAHDNYHPQEEFKAAEGLGVRRARIGMREFMVAKAKYGHLYPNGNPWADPEFVAAYIRDNPHVRVRTTRGTRGQEYAGRASVPRGTIYVPSQYANRQSEPNADAISH